jgi:hypothetical protein
MRNQGIWVSMYSGETEGRGQACFITAHCHNNQSMLVSSRTRSQEESINLPWKPHNFQHCCLGDQASMSFGGGNPIWSIAVIGPGSSFLLSRLYSRMSPTQFGLSKAFEIHFPRWSVLTSLMSMVERHSYAQNLPPLIAPLPPNQ